MINIDYLNWHVCCSKDTRDNVWGDMMATIFGIHEKALLVHELRAELLATNIANVDTPNYKAKDIDFATLLKNQLDTGQENTSDQANPASLQDAILYRTPMQVSIDGNTVDEQVEQAKYSENAMHYLASLNFINSKVSNILLALKGDQ